MYILVSHTNGRSVKNTIGMVVNRLVGMGLKGMVMGHTLSCCSYAIILGIPILNVYVGSDSKRRF